ncbi:S-layer homology domain-containing protein [Paenibacillus sp. R14(2021)]|uniref:S-layer homology domain-containing protein n=1 Tax=Paenibacillus sp. R14(2021) TaxID=2859228 RepID=UPI001C61224F|nr:S-layer homology domain-containing protein [Paenibacillus sp. R14(2021)]
MKKNLILFLLAFIFILPFASTGLAAAKEDAYVSDLRYEASSLTSHSVNLEWTPNPNAVTVTLHYKKAGGSEQTINLDATAAKATVQGLDAATTYQFELRGRCDTCQNLFSNNLEVTTPQVSSTPTSSPSASNFNSEGVDRTDSGVTLGEEAYLLHNSTDAGGNKVATLTLDKEKLTQAFSLLAGNSDSAQTVVLPFEGDDDIVRVRLPADVLAANTNHNAVISIVTNTSGYDLPLGSLDIAKIVGDLGMDLKSTYITITIKKVNGAIKEELLQKAEAQGISLLGDAYEFEITVEDLDKSAPFNDFGTTYVTKSIVVNAPLNGSASTTVYDPKTGAFVFVPGFRKDGQDQIRFQMKRAGNSIYAVVASKKSFADLEQHWAKTDIELLASKLLLKGVSIDKFEPNAEITRAEFVVMLVRALGLSPGPTDASFSDVTADNWYSDAIGTAVRAGLIKGFEDSTFKPNAPITRLQMVTIIANAFGLTEKSLDITGKEAAMLNRFSDRASIPKIAENATCQVLLAGILKGNVNGTFNPKGSATRAEAAVMLHRFLVFAALIEE